MWCPEMGYHIKHKEKYKKRIYDLVAMNQLSNERMNCMRKRYYNYDLGEWTIAKCKVEKKYRENFTTNSKTETYPR